MNGRASPGVRPAEFDTRILAAASDLAANIEADRQRIAKLKADMASAAFVSSPDALKAGRQRIRELEEDIDTNEVVLAACKQIDTLAVYLVPVESVAGRMGGADRESFHAMACLFGWTEEQPAKRLRASLAGIWKRYWRYKSAYDDLQRASSFRSRWVEVEGAADEACDSIQGAVDLLAYWHPQWLPSDAVEKMREIRAFAEELRGLLNNASTIDDRLKSAVRPQEFLVLAFAEMWTLNFGLPVPHRVPGNTTSERHNGWEGSPAEKFRFVLELFFEIADFGIDKRLPSDDPLDEPQIGRTAGLDYVLRKLTSPEYNNTTDAVADAVERMVAQRNNSSTSLRRPPKGTWLPEQDDPLPLLSELGDAPDELEDHLEPHEMDLLFNQQDITFEWLPTTGLLKRVKADSFREEDNA